MCLTTGRVRTRGGAAGQGGGGGSSGHDGRGGLVVVGRRSAADATLQPRLVEAISLQRDAIRLQLEARRLQRDAIRLQLALRGAPGAHGAVALGQRHGPQLRWGGIGEI
jgi:hypothetical protein